MLLCSCCFAAKQDDWPKEWCMENDYRSWKNSRGQTVMAKWIHVSEDEKYIWLGYQKSGKYVKMSVGLFSSEDAKHINTVLADCKRSGLVWFRGCYVRPSTKRRFEYIKKASEYMWEKSDKGPMTLKVFQALDYGALCNVMEKSKYTDSWTYSSRGAVYYNIGKKGLLANGEMIENKKLYWAGVMKYQTVKGDYNTVNCYADTESFAVHLIRMRMDLYDKDDPEFSDESEGVVETKKPNATPELYCTGSGFFATKDGYVVTNNHVIDGGSIFEVLTNDGTFPAQVVKRDVETDLALLKVNRTNCPNCKFATRKKENLGAEVFTMGFPMPGLQGFSPKVTKGIVSGEYGFKGNVHEYQIDATIQPGNSGGPLFDVKGNLVGVVVATLKCGQAVNYAIKKSYLLAFLDALGLEMENADDSVEGKETFTEVVNDVRQSCVLIKTYR